MHQRGIFVILKDRKGAHSGNLLVSVARAGSERLQSVGHLQQQSTRELRASYGRVHEDQRQGHFGSWGGVDCGGSTNSNAHRFGYLSCCMARNPSAGQQASKATQPGLTNSPSTSKEAGGFFIIV